MFFEIKFKRLVKDLITDQINDGKLKKKRDTIDQKNSRISFFKLNPLRFISLYLCLRND